MRRRTTRRQTPPRPGRGSLRTWTASVSGVAAVEFALILPVLIALYFGLVAVTVGLNMHRKVTLLSRSLADLSSRRTTMSGPDLATIFQASAAVLQPYDPGALQMVVSSVRVDRTRDPPVGTIDWSCGRNLPATPGQPTRDWSDANLVRRPPGARYDVPAGFETNPSFILVETKLPYAPVVGQSIIGTRIISETVPWPVRNGAEVAYTGSCPAG